MKFTELGEIAIAWYRAADPTPEQQLLALERLAVCESCVHCVKSNRFVGYKCDACGCPIHTKIFASSAQGCPKGKWNR